MPETESQPDKKRLSFNQNFWLICIGVPLLLVATFLIIVIIVPKPLNSTEQKLLGKWEVVSPAWATPAFVEFHRDQALYANQSWFWTANENSLFTEMLATDKPDQSLWHIIRLKLNFPKGYERWKLVSVSEQELQIRHPTMSDRLVFQRVK